MLFTLCMYLDSATVDYTGGSSLMLMYDYLFEP